MEYHRARFQRTYHAVFNEMPVYDFAAKLSVPEEYQEGLVKLKIPYNQTDQQFVFEHYQPKIIKSLKFVVDDEINYEYKYSDRSRIDHLFQKRGSCDDVLIVRHGLVTDTSYCNIVFYDGSRWITPSTPLLKGTMRQRLLDDGVISEGRIKVEDLGGFLSFKLVNAMRGFDAVGAIKIEHIKG